ncbi:hypothetical protein GO730_08805 [Spirosoma sp. HMF3257]|nr:hypothetical protein [Spirosoma telluris]
MNELNELLAYFQGRNLPDTEFVISRWARTCNLRQCVQLALINARNGNKTSTKTLRLIREKLELMK